MLLMLPTKREMTTRLKVVQLPVVGEAHQSIIALFLYFTRLIVFYHHFCSQDRFETSTQAAETNEMESILQSIGIVSPVTKFSAGRLYHQQLARQMADLLLSQGRLSRLGGMITLADLYCLFNRARGTEVSCYSFILYYYYIESTIVIL